MSVIIKSTSKVKPNWSGKEFSANAAKLYTDFDDAVSALNSYCFYTYDTDKNEYVKQGHEEITKDKYKREIRIIHITEKKQNELLAAGKIRY